MKNILSDQRLETFLDEIFQALFVDQMGVNHTEHLFVKILELLQSDDEARACFMKHTTNEIVGGCPVIPSGTIKRPLNFIDEDLMCFIAHATRWKEFKIAISVRKATKTYTSKLQGSKDIADLIEEALTDDWQDKEFYQWFVK